MTTDPLLPRRPRRKPTPEPHVGRLQQRVEKGQTLAEAAESLGIPLWLAKAVFVRSGLPLPRPSQSARARLLRGRTPVGTGRRAAVSRGRLDDFGVLLALRLMAHQLGLERGARGPVHVSRTDWDARRDPRMHPGASAVTIRFGSWSAACEQAGVPLRGRATRRLWTEDECLQAVRVFLEASTERTSAADYTAWAKGRDVPSLPTVAARLGSWAQARARARG